VSAEVTDALEVIVLEVEQVLGPALERSSRRERRRRQGPRRPRRTCAFELRPPQRLDLRQRMNPNRCEKALPRLWCAATTFASCVRSERSPHKTAHASVIAEFPTNQVILSCVAETKNVGNAAKARRLVVSPQRVPVADLSTASSALDLSGRELRFFFRRTRFIPPPAADRRAADRVACDSIFSAGSEWTGDGCDISARTLLGKNFSLLEDCPRLRYGFGTEELDRVRSSVEPRKPDTADRRNDAANTRTTGQADCSDPVAAVAERSRAAVSPRPHRNLHVVNEARCMGHSVFLLVATSAWQVCLVKLRVYAASVVVVMPRASANCCCVPESFWSHVAAVVVLDRTRDEGCFPKIARARQA